MCFSLAVSPPPGTAAHRGLVEFIEPPSFFCDEDRLLNARIDAPYFNLAVAITKVMREFLQVNLSTSSDE